MNASMSPVVTTARRQRGSVLVNTAIALSLVVIVLVGLELGYLFSAKRDFQKSVDLAALAGAQALQPFDCAPARAAAVANAAQNLPAGFTLASTNVTCGRWDSATQPAPRHFGTPASGEKFNAVQVTFSATPALLLPAIPGNQTRTLVVEALASQRYPAAVLNIRSTLVSVDTTRSDLLNKVFGGLLGGVVNLDAVGWTGLLNTDIKLLGYLDELAVDMNIAAGQYDQVLNTQASVSTLLQAAITALQRDGSTSQVAVDALNVLKLAANAASATPLVKVGDLLGVQTGIEAAGLNADLQVFQLAQGLIQLSNNKSSVVANLPVTVPGLGTATVKLKVGEAPRISAVGDPELAELDPLGADKINVQTAQLRALISVNLPGLGGVTGLLNAVTQLLSPVTTLLNTLQAPLNLQAIVGNLVCISCQQSRVVLVPQPAVPWRLSVYLEAPASQAHITEVNCNADGSSDLAVATRTSLSSVRIGIISAADEAAALASGGLTPPVTPIPLLDTETRNCTTILGIGSCDAWVPYSRTGLSAVADLGTSSGSPPSLSYINPPTLDSASAYQSMSGTNIVSSVGTSLTGLKLQTYRYSAGSPNGFGTLIGGATDLIQSAFSAVANVVNTLLAPLLDGLINTLLNSLGVQIAHADIGARLSCEKGAQLVY